MSDAVAKTPGSIRGRAATAGLLAILALGVIVVPAWLGAILWGCFLVVSWLLG